jgi:hypothetical protein
MIKLRQQYIRTLIKCSVKCVEYIHVRHHHKEHARSRHARVLIFDPISYYHYSQTSEPGEATTHSCRSQQTC